MMIDGVIFDLDGTLWDSAEAVAHSWTDTASRYSNAARIFTAEDIHGVMGMTMEKISRFFFGHLSEELRREVTDACFTEECDYVEKVGGILYPSLCKTLTNLKERYRLFIVSNCQVGYIEAFFAYHGLSHFFDDYEDYGRTGMEKDANLRLLIERNGLRHPVYVGDTKGDHDACVKAGVPFVHAAYGFGQVEGVPKIDTFADLPAVLARHFEE